MTAQDALDMLALAAREDRARRTIRELGLRATGLPGQWRVGDEDTQCEGMTLDLALERYSDALLRRVEGL